MSSPNRRCRSLPPLRSLVRFRSEILGRAVLSYLDVEDLGRGSRPVLGRHILLRASAVRSRTGRRRPRATPTPKGGAGSLGAQPGGEFSSRPTG